MAITSSSKTTALGQGVPGPNDCAARLGAGRMTKFKDTGIIDVEEKITFQALRGQKRFDDSVLVE